PGPELPGAGQTWPPKGATRPRSRNFQPRIVSLAPVSPVSEGIEQVLPHSLRKILLGELACCSDRRPELPQILGAAGAPHEVLLHLGPGALVERAVQELGEQVDELLADQLVRPSLAHGATSAAHPASA